MGTFYIKNRDSPRCEKTANWKVEQGVGMWVVQTAEKEGGEQQRLDRVRQTLNGEQWPNS
jgi:hypothetical protein